MREIAAKDLRRVLDLVHAVHENTTAAVLFNDEAPGAYENRAVILVKIRWGRIVFEETYEDTQKVADWEERTGGPVALVASD